MKTINFYINLVLISFIFSSCSNVLDKPINSDDFDQIKTIINKDTSLKHLKKEYILDNLSIYLNMLEANGHENFNNSASFRVIIDELKVQYDSIETLILLNIESNNKLKNFIELSDAKAMPVLEDMGYLKMIIQFHNNFDKDVLYVRFNYKFIDKLNKEYFSENVKLTEKIAKTFKGKTIVTIPEEMNEVADFMYKIVPKDKNNEFMMEGLKIEVLEIGFKDKSSLTMQNEDWKYLQR